MSRGLNGKYVTVCKCYRGEPKSDDLPNDGLLFFLNAVGHDELATPDDMEVLAMLAIVIIPIAVAGIVVWLANVAITCLRAGRART
ncbi:hypothetical protein ACS0Y3_00605 [Burkholderia gladioli]|uniref:hypothetical protein n=1 Tax=Burkholderia gladioli TaxID=28095 RepID=UPI003F7AC5AC